MKTTYYLDDPLTPGLFLERFNTFKSSYPNLDYPNLKFLGAFLYGGERVKLMSAPCYDFLTDPVDEGIQRINAQAAAFTPPTFSETLRKSGFRKTCVGKMESVVRSPGEDS